MIRRIILASACALALVAVSASSAAAIPTLGPNSLGSFVNGIEEVGGYSDLPGKPAGYYRVQADPTATNRSVITSITVYWMPKGTADQAPPEIRALPEYKNDVSSGATERADATILGPNSGALAGAVSSSDCFAGYFCVFGGTSYRYSIRRWADPNPYGVWGHLSDADVTSSVINRRSYDSRLSEHVYGNDRPGGKIRCYDSYSSVPYVGASFDNIASGRYNNLTDTLC